MTDFTAHFRFQIPDFLQDPWHAELEAAIRAIDTAIYEALLIDGAGNWANSTVYAVGAIVIDAATGLMWTCAVANTSSAAPTTFAQERVAHPTYWNATATIPQQRGAWTTATSYIPGDFVVESNRYAVCLVAHVSAALFNTDLAAARWVVLIDLSTLGVGLNATAEDTIAAAATTDIGSKAASRLSVTGSAVITSFGVVANTYKILRFAAGSTLTNSANLILLSANITTEANDVAFFSSDSIGRWRCYFYTRASGVPIGQPDASEAVKGIAELATQGEVDAGVDALRIVTPVTLKTRLDALTTSIVNSILGGVGASLDTLSEIATAIGFLAPKANPTFTGTAIFDQIAATGNATGVTGADTDDDTSFATTAFVNDAAKWTRQVFLASGTWNRPAGCKKIRVQIVAGGGEGGAPTGGSGSNGGNSSFDTTVAGGGQGGAAGSGSASNGGDGGSGGTGPATLRIPGAGGLTGLSNGNSGSGAGASGPFGGGGRPVSGTTGRAGAPNSGSGGAGSQSGGNIAGGGGAGEYVELDLNNPGTGLSVVVGAGGTGVAGGDGGSGLVIVWEYYFVP